MNDQMFNRLMELKETSTSDLYAVRQRGLLEKDYPTVDAANFELRARSRASKAETNYGLGHCERCGATLTVADVEERKACTQCGTRA